MINPLEGEIMAARCVEVIRGSKKPFEVDFSSSIEDELGTVVPILTGPGKEFCAVAF
jgi:hypothetical protein